MDAIVPLELRTMMVRKSPISVLYGNFKRIGVQLDFQGHTP
ncbi:hypothetical protein [Thauera sp. SDU_THAU2]